MVTLFECAGCVVCLLVLQRTNWPAVFGLGDGWDLVTVLVSCTCAYFLLQVNVRLLSQLASTAVLFVAALLCFQSALGQQLSQPDGFLCPPSSLGAVPSGSLLTHTTFQPEGFGTAVGLVFFCFAGHATFPTLRNQMAAEERPYFERGLDTGFAVAGASYLLFAAL